MGRAFFLGAAAAIASANAVVAQSHPSATPRVAGCYDTRLGSWSPFLPIGGDTIYMTPPARVRLWSQLSPDWRSESAFAITPLGPSRRPAHKFGIYRVVNRDSIDVTFSNGLSGVRLALGARHDSLVGLATSFWDFPRPPQSAPALLVKQPCPGPEKGKPPARWAQ